jgi:hypothetical protein
LKRVVVHGAAVVTALGAVVALFLCAGLVRQMATGSLVVQAWSLGRRGGRGGASGLVEGSYAAAAAVGAGMLVSGAAGAQPWLASPGTDLCKAGPASIHSEKN